MSAPLPSRPAALLAGLSGGLVGGTAVGVGEAFWSLSRSEPAEYQALVYGAVLYGLVGGGLGLGLGALFALPRRGARPSTVWSLAAGMVVAGMGLAVAVHLLDRSVYDERGVPLGVFASLAATVGLLTLAGVWLGRLFLEKTPLRVLPGAKGTAVGWGLMVGLAALFSVAPAPGAEGERAPARPQFGLEGRPDVLLVLIDTLRADALGAWGNGPEATPALDALARDGVVFEQFVTAAAWTRPSVATLLTGLHPSTHTCQAKDAALPAAVETLAEVLQKNGYATGGFPNNPNVSGALGFGQGFDWYVYRPTFPFGARESTYGLTLYTALRQAWSRATTVRRPEHHYRPAEALLPEVRAWIDDQGGARWFAFVHLMEPHDPYFAHPYDGTAVGRLDAPGPERVDELRARYAGEVRHVDAELGRFLDGLRADGRYDDLLIVVTSDHGEELGEHGGYWHGHTLYDEQVRVPLIVKLPGNARAGTRVPWQVRQVDVAPTVAQLAEVAPSPSWQGQELFPDDFDRQLALMQPPTLAPPEPDDDAPPPPPADWRPPTWADHPASRDALSEQAFDGYELRSLRSGGLKLVQTVRASADDPRGLPPRACYALLADPGETRDLLRDDVDCAARLEPRLAALLAEARQAAVDLVGADLPPGERARLEALGYAPAPSSDPGE